MKADMTIFINSEMGFHHVNGCLAKDNSWNDFESALNAKEAIKIARQMGKSAISNGDSNTVEILKWKNRKNEWKLVQTYGMTKMEKKSAEIDVYVQNLKTEEQFVKYAR